MPRVRKRRLLTKAREMGVDVEIRKTSLGWDVDMWSPAGKVFAATGCHSAVTNLMGVTAGETYAAAMEDLEAGLLPCEIEECENCEPGA